MSNISFYNDLHLHTNLSPCGSKTTFVKSYLELCEAEGVNVIGISNHIYSDDNAKLVAGLRDEIDEFNGIGKVKLLLGGEIEVMPGVGASMSVSAAKPYDYVILAASHISADDYPDVQLFNPDTVREILLEKFFFSCDIDLGVPAGICHPFYPNGAYCVNLKEIIDGITDEQLSDCFSYAKSKNKSIEIHASVARPNTPLNSDGLSDAFLRVLSAAKAEGCHFHFGSDSHSHEAFVGSHKMLYLAAEKLGLCDSDIWDIVKI